MLLKNTVFLLSLIASYAAVASNTGHHSKPDIEQIQIEHIQGGKGINPPLYSVTRRVGKTSYYTDTNNPSMTKTTEDLGDGNFEDRTFMNGKEMSKFTYKMHEPKD